MATTPITSSQRRPAFYTVEEAASVMKLHPQTIYRMTWDGRIPVKRFGSAVRIPAHALDTLTA